MRTIIRKFALLIIPFLLAATALDAATVTILHSFGVESYDPSAYGYTNSDGYYLEAPVLVSSNFIYGTSYEGGTNALGVIYRVNADGSGFTNLHIFSYLDGGSPRSSLVLSSNTLYGTTSGGDSGEGSIFAIHTDGTGYTNLLYIDGFPYYDSYPEAGLVLSSNLLYGTVEEGGTFGYGAVFRVNLDGSGLTNIYNFSTVGYSASGYNTNKDGDGPYADLFLSSNVLYGTTQYGGTNGAGVVFRVNLDGTGFTNLHNFAALFSSSPGAKVNSDGADPMSGVILYSNALYGATYDGGTNGTGVIYKLNPDGTGFTNLFIFNGHPNNTNYGGGNSYATLTASGGKLYGTTQLGGAYGGGTFFSVDANGVFTALFDFAVNPMLVGSPSAGVTVSGSTFYGPSYGGGTNEAGTIYSLSLSLASPPVTLNAQISAGSLVINWTNAAFSLQAAPALSGPYATITNAVPPYQIAPTNQQQYFRLRSN
jgi:uncharacterized repeat protein (TIGR03803 family)